MLKIRFHELKCPGIEIIKQPSWGPIHNNLPRLVALIKVCCMCHVFRCPVYWCTCSINCLIGHLHLIVEELCNVAGHTFFSLIDE